MQNIQMVDLKGQYEQIKSEVDRRIAGVIDSTAFINGPEVKQFQEELQDYLDVKHVIPCGNGTDALQIAMMALDLKPGDEVITTTFTFVATVEVIALLGLKPVLVDVDPDTFLIDVDQVEKAISHKTKAIVPVHLFGQCADMDRLMQLSEEHGIAIIEDTAQAIGAEFKGKKAGTIGQIGCTSFFPSKNLGCYGDGGAIFTQDDHLAAKIRKVVNHGMEKRYYHDEVGVNSRLDSIQAAILSVKLKQLDQYNQARREAAAFYDTQLGEIEALQTPVRTEDSSHVFHQYTLRVLNGKRDELKEHLDQKGIPAMIYYPVPMHKQKAYEFARFQLDAFPHTDQISEEVLSLPMHTELTNEQLTHITNSIKEFFSR
jgi:dTDP-4-amino-4,6-dideoxygalactose transaminase